MSQEVIMLIGCPASGKSTLAQGFVEEGYLRLNRDTLGGKIRDLEPLLEQALQQGQSVVLDNTHFLAEQRAPFIAIARRRSVPIRAIWLDTSIEQAQYNAALRIYQKCDRMLSPEELKKSKDPNIFPTAVLFGFNKKFQQPKLAEGFSSLKISHPIRTYSDEYVNKALILDYDGTLRRTKSGRKFPVDPDDIEILPDRIQKLQQYHQQGYRLLGVSNQSGIHKQELTLELAHQCFERTNELLGLEIWYLFCPHISQPIQCYCRKPMPGLGVQFIEQYKLQPSECLMVGDMTTDRTFAERCGFPYQDQGEFFA